MARICLSYRRSDSSAITGRIYDHLAQRYGVDSVFMDVGSIPYGVDYRDHIRNVFEGAKILVAIMGPGWLGPQSEGEKRIHERIDPVRVEIQTALLEDIFILPVLVEGAMMPAAVELPSALKPLSYRNALRVESGSDFSFHIERLIASIDDALGVSSDQNTAAPLDGSTTRPRLTPKPILTTRKPRPIRLLPYCLAMMILLLIAHYVMVMKLDLDRIYLRGVTIIIPAVCGFLLLRNMRLGIGSATIVGLIGGLGAIAGMTIVVGLIDGHSILPSGTAEWQEAFEYVATITLAVLVGYVFARFAEGLQTGRTSKL